MKINFNDIPEITAGTYDAYNKLAEIRTAESGSQMITLRWQLDDGLDTNVWDNLVYATIKENKLTINSVGARQIKTLLEILGKLEDYPKGFDPEKDVDVFKDTNLRIRIKVEIFRDRKQAKWVAYLPADEDAPEF